LLSLLLVANRKKGWRSLGNVEAWRTFLNGEDIEINYAETIKWFEMASVKGSARAKSYWRIILVSGGHGV
jgi:hypothetical protein